MFHFFETPHGSEAIRLFYNTWSLDLLGWRSRRALLARIERLDRRPYASREIETQRSWMAIDWLVRFYTSGWFDCAYLKESADKLKALAPIVNRASAHASEDVLRAARAAWNDARDLAWKNYLVQCPWALTYVTKKDAKTQVDHLALLSGRDAAAAANYLVKESDGVAPFWDPAVTADWVILNHSGRYLVDTLQSSVLDLVERMHAVKE